MIEYVCEDILFPVDAPMEILGRIPTTAVDAGINMVLRHADFTDVVGIILLYIS
jgi:hypothetical protein